MVERAASTSNYETMRCLITGAAAELHVHELMREPGIAWTTTLCELFKWLRSSKTLSASLRADTWRPPP